MSATVPSLRLGWVDSARGLALWAMFGFHLTWDLAFFGWIDRGFVYSPGFHWLGHVIGASFLTLVGISLVLARQAHGTLLRSRSFWRRWGMIVAAAAAISAVSFWFFPQAPIFFGILHCIALASLIAAPFVEAPLWGLLAAGALALVAPALLAAPLFDAPVFWWTGLGTFEPPSNDFRPLLPWLGFVLFGVAIGQRLPRRREQSETVFSATAQEAGSLRDARKRGLFIRALSYCGRHSLAFYLLHQPLLFGLFSLLALFVVSPDQERQFVGQCAAQCFQDTGEADLCQRTCACTVARAKARGAWTRMARNALTNDEKTQAHNDIMACFGDSASH